jgi:hypothetical protein
VIENKNINNLKSERVRCLPNVNSLMKISLGLIFFTIISTAFVYAETLSVDVDGTSFDVQYTTVGMTVTGIESDTESMSLIFSVDVTDSTGTLNVELKRSFFDSIYDNVDDLFFILADNDKAISEEIQTTSQSRSLIITVPSGTVDLEIIGSGFNNSVKEIIVEEIIVEEIIVEEIIVEEIIVEEIIVEEIIVEEIIVEEIIVEEIIVNDMPDNECGPGTILENNICILDQRCGPGTILQGNACVLDSTLVKSSSTGYTKELIMSVTTALGIAGVIGIVLAIIARVNKNKN